MRRRCPNAQHGQMPSLSPEDCVISQQPHVDRMRNTTAADLTRKSPPWWRARRVGFRWLLHAPRASRGSASTAVASCSD